MRVPVRVHPLTAIVQVVSQLTRPKWCTDCCARGAGVHRMLLGADVQGNARVPVMRAYHRLHVCDRVCGRHVQLHLAFACIAARQQQQRGGVAALVVSTSGADSLPPSVTVVSVPAPSSPRRARSAALECSARSRLASRACTTSACFAAAVSASRARTARRGTPRPALHAAERAWCDRLHACLR